MAFKRITFDPNRMNGQPCVRRLRLTVRRVVEAVAITKGKPDFGPREQIFYGEFAGRGRERVLVQILAE